MSDVKSLLRVQYSTKDLQNLINAINENKETYEEITRDNSLIKRIVNTVSYMSTLGVNSTISVGGWRELINGSDINTQMNEIITNPAVIMYTQMVLQIALSIQAEENKVT